MPPGFKDVACSSPNSIILSASTQKMIAHEIFFISVGLPEIEDNK
jgi:hypothetical protein